MTYLGFPELAQTSALKVLHPEHPSAGDTPGQLAVSTRTRLFSRLTFTTSNPTQTVKGLVPVGHFPDSTRMQCPCEDVEDALTPARTHRHGDFAILSVIMVSVVLQKSKLLAKENFTGRPVPLLPELWSLCRDSASQSSHPHPFNPLGLRSSVLAAHQTQNADFILWEREESQTFVTAFKTPPRSPTVGSSDCSRFQDENCCRVGIHSACHPEPIAPSTRVTQCRHTVSAHVCLCAQL